MRMDHATCTTTALQLLEALGRAQAQNTTVPNIVSLPVTNILTASNSGVTTSPATVPAPASTNVTLSTNHSSVELIKACSFHFIQFNILLYTGVHV